MMKPLKRILTIDDDDDIRRIGALVLKKKGGFDVVSKPSGQEALDYLESSTGNNLPDLIILDVMMPEMDGPQTLEAIRGLEPHASALIPIIFMTAKCQADEVERLIDLGAAGVIPKPFDAMTLSGQVREIWEGI